MTKHCKVYMEYFDYGETDFIPCEACGSPAVDIHHIFGRGGDEPDTIGNLIALCRKHHERAHKDVGKEAVLYIHNCFLSGQRKVFLK